MARMTRRWRIAQVTVAPEGDAPWTVVGAQQALAAESQHGWGHTDWAWGTAELMSFLRRARYERCELLIAVDLELPEGDPAAVLGAAIIELPLQDNTSFASVSVWARPTVQDCRAPLLDASLELSRREGRSTLLLETDHHTAQPGQETIEPRSGVGRLPLDPLAELAVSRGLALEQVERISTFRFPADVETLRSLREDAAAHAGPDYVVHSWQGDTPEHWLDGLAGLIGRMSTDAPLAGIDYEAEAWDAERVRERDAVRPEKNRGSLTVVVEHAPSGELAAFTEVEWPLSEPEVAYQFDTLVAGSHRGHRLGMLVKTSQLLELGRIKPELRRLHTWNASENRHMLAINEALGFEAVGSSGEWQITLELD